MRLFCVYFKSVTFNIAPSWHCLLVCRLRSLCLLTFMIMKNNAIFNKIAFIAFEATLVLTNGNARIISYWIWMHGIGTEKNCINRLEALDTRRHFLGLWTYQLRAFVNQELLFCTSKKGGSKSAFFAAWWGSCHPYSSHLYSAGSFL